MEGNGMATDEPPPNEDPPPTAQASAPKAAPAQAPAPAPIEARADDALVVAEYTAESPRTYYWPDGPQTAQLGDVCAVPGIPEDGCWQAAPGVLITRLRDNHPDNTPGPPDRENVATSLADREAILARLGLDGTEANR